MSQWYPPEPTPQPQWIAEALLTAGCDVQVLTGIPNYPHGEVADGYSAWRGGDERIGNVHVRRTPLFPSHNHSATRRMINYASWALSSAVAGLGVLRRSDVVLVYSSPATAALPAMVARVLFRVPYVLQIQDIWPDSMFASGLLGGRTMRVLRLIANRFVSAAYRMADEIVVISPGAAQLLESRGVRPSKMTLVFNWVPEDNSSICIRDAAAIRGGLGIPSDAFVLMYAGNHGAAQALESVVEAFSTPEMPRNCHLIMVGQGVVKDNLRKLAQQRGSDRVHFVDPVPKEQMPRYMAASDAQLVSLAPEPLFAATMPSKVQAILQAGVPALVAVEGDAARIVKEAKAGVAAAPGDRAELVSAVTDLASRSRSELWRMGQSGRRYYQDHMTEQIGVSRLTRVLERAAQRQRGRRTQDSLAKPSDHAV